MRPRSRSKRQGGAVKDLAVGAKGAIDEHREKSVERKRFSKLKKEADELDAFREEKERRDRAEDFVFGRPLTEKERAEFARFKKEQAGRKSQRKGIGSILIGTAPTSSVARRTPAAQPGRQSGGMRDSRRDSRGEGRGHRGMDFITGRGSSRSKKKGKKDVDYSLGGLL